MVEDVTGKTNRERPADYATMKIADLRISRRGKHHTLISGILRQLENLSDRSALIIPLDSVGELPVAGLRSAITRATRARHIAIKTHSDEKKFYVWKVSNGAGKRKTRS
jgi:hypothetical protein